MKPRIATTLMLAVLAGCVPSPLRNGRDTPAPPAAVAQSVVPPTPLPPPPPPLSNSPEEVLLMAPSGLVVGARKARQDALGYAAWSQSRIDNIERLNELVRELNTAMDAMAVKGRKPKIVASARSALFDLRTFLATKGD